jgi:hypothetical protein
MVKKKKVGNLTIRFITQSELLSIDTHKRIKVILDLVLENKIVIIQGNLNVTEEASLIQSTMALVGKIKGFRGIEIETLHSTEQNSNLMRSIKSKLAKVLIGDSNTLTIIGPASLVKEIKKDPKKLEFMLKK